MDDFGKLYDLAVKLKCDVKKDEPMKKYTSYEIGGPADLFISPNSESSLKEIRKKAKEYNIKLYTVGNATNILIPDEGLRGAVIHISDGFREIKYSGGGIIDCCAGVSLSKLCGFAAANGLTGLEFAFGIPGSAGGGAFMNAGAYGGEMKDVLTMCSHITDNGDEGAFVGSDLDLSYRHSIYSNNGYTITKIQVKLKNGDKEEIYSKMKELMKRRKEKQPLEFPSAGSVFKRPAGHYAGTLIEQCGLKGKKIGGAQVSEKHAGFIVNRGGATCSDVVSLIDFVKNEVFRQTGVELEPEIRVWR